MRAGARARPRAPPVQPQHTASSSALGNPTKGTRREVPALGQHTGEPRPKTQENLPSPMSLHGLGAQAGGQLGRGAVAIPGGRGGGRHTGENPERGSERWGHPAWGGRTAVAVAVTKSQARRWPQRPDPVLGSADFGHSINFVEGEFASAALPGSRGGWISTALLRLQPFARHDPGSSAPGSHEALPSCPRAEDTGTATPGQLAVQGCHRRELCAAGPRLPVLPKPRRGRPQETVLPRKSPRACTSLRRAGSPGVPRGNPSRTARPVPGSVPPVEPVAPGAAPVPL